jgi:hypothetical protein
MTAIHPSPTDQPVAPRQRPRGPLARLVHRFVHFFVYRSVRCSMPGDLPRFVPVLVWAAASVVLVTAAAPVGAQTPGAAQTPGVAPPPGSGWDDARALELMELARQRRLLPQQDTALRNYSARAEGFVYFYLDRRETEERTLIKVDQVALEVFWAPPDRTKQRIVGLRDESRLPNRMYYHLDHLTVVQDGFGDVIRMGDGDEVGDVPHPAAGGSGEIYEFRLADSLTLQLPGAPSPIRVYELQVRPRRVDQPALVGSVFVDRAGGDIVRMTFTFTPSSYVDRRLDYISVSLDNGLWDGRYWLPHEQTLQIRRQVPELDFAAGAVIHGRMRISDYVFNDSLPNALFYGPPVTAVPHAQRQTYEFQRGIFDDLNEAGLAPPADLAEVRQQAAAMLGTQRLSGLPAWRLNLTSASSALRYNRAEGLAVGAGVAYDPGTWRAELGGGYALGPGAPWLNLTVSREPSARDRVLLRLGYREVHDAGVMPGVPPAINTLAAMFLGRDYLDPYYVNSARILLRRALSPQLHAFAELSGEEHSSASLTQTAAMFSDSARFRAVRPIDETVQTSLAMGLTRPLRDPLASAWGGLVRVEAAAAGTDVFLRPTAEASLRRASADHAHVLTASISGGALAGNAPSQRLFVLGGHNTLPGYRYREFAGTRYGLARAELTSAILSPWLGVRVLAAAGITGGLPSTSAAPAAVVPPAWRSWPVAGTAGVRSSAGAGVSLLWDMLRIDAVRGIRGGAWQLQLSFHRDFWDIS